MDALERSRRQQAFAARVTARRASVTHSCESPAQYEARQAREARQAHAATQQRERQAHARQADMAAREQARQATSDRQAHLHASLPADVTPSVVTVPARALSEQARAIITDRLTRVRLSHSPNYLIDQFNLDREVARIEKMPESDRLLLKADVRIERDLLANIGAQTAHRCLVSDDTWLLTYSVAPRIYRPEPTLADYRLVSHGSRLRLRGYGSSDVTQGCTVTVRLAGSTGAGLVPHKLYEPEPVIRPESDEARQARETEQARQANAAAEAQHRESATIRALIAAGIIGDND